METQETTTTEERLVASQMELKAPKNRRNQFGGYNYRSAEDILEAAKPVCMAHGLLLNVSDEMVAVDNRIYVKATARVTDIKTFKSIEVCGWAREADSKKGMDDSQITGTASSYARKYALNGLFCIDDNQDADTMERARELAKCAAISAENRQEFEAAFHQWSAVIKADADVRRAFEKVSHIFPKETSSKPTTAKEATAASMNNQ